MTVFSTGFTFKSNFIKSYIIIILLLYSLYSPSSHIFTSFFSTTSIYKTIFFLLLFLLLCKLLFLSSFTSFLLKFYFTFFYLVFHQAFSLFCSFKLFLIILIFHHIFILLYLLSSSFFQLYLSFLT